MVAASDEVYCWTFQVLCIIYSKLVGLLRKIWRLHH